MASQPIRILLVEDNPADARLLQEALAETAEPFDVSHVELLQAALDRVASEPFDAVLLDLFLPDSRGMETVERATAAVPQAPIVVLTGSDDEAVAIEAVRRGAQDFLVKGFADGRSLARAIRYAVERKRAEEALVAARAQAVHERNRLEALMESLPVGVSILDDQGGNVQANTAFEQLWGGPRPLPNSVKDYALYKAWWADTGRPVQPEQWASARAVRHGESVVGQLMQIERFDGTRAFVLNSAVPIRDAGGQITGSAVAIMDITALKQAEQALREVNEQLEDRVLKRTAELEQANRALQQENAERRKAEQAVGAQRRRFQELLDKLPAYLVLLSPDYHVAFANRFFEERFGKSGGRRCFEYLFHRTVPCENCETFKVLRTNAPHHWEWAGPDGRNYDIYDFPFTDTDGLPLVMEVGLDVTDRKRMEEEFRAASSYARSLIEASLDPLVTISPGGRIMDVNEATEEVTGVPRERLIGSDFSEYFTDPGKAREGYRKVISEGLVRDYPLTIRHASGRTTDVSYNATVYRNEAGEVQGVFAGARDVTDRLRAEKAIWESEMRYRSLALATTLIVWTTNAQGDVVDDLPSWRAFTGQTEEEVQGWGWIAALHPEERQPAAAAWSRSVETRTLYETEYRARRHDGEYRHMAVRGVPVLEQDGTIREWVGTCTDVTERKRAEEQLRALNEALERRAEQLRALAAELTQAEQRERHRLAQVLHDHLQQLLYAARLSLGATRARVQTEPLQAVLQRLDDLLRESIEAARSLTVELSPPIVHVAGLATSLEWLGQHVEERYGLGVALEADPRIEIPAEDLRLLLFQAVRELLFNVVKHAHVERAEVRLTRPDDEHVQIVVQDEGAGFDAAEQQSDGSCAAGFGLFSLRKRLELIGGSLEVDSSPGRGTRVVVRAPCPPPVQAAAAGDGAGSAQPRSAETPPEVRPGRRGAGKIRVLLADDHKLLREGLARLFREQPDLELVGEAEDGRSAVELALETQPDVVIMDVAMPVLNGIEATRRIVAALPGARVIGLSMHQEEDMVKAMLEAGATAYLLKGGSSEPLIAAIRRSVSCQDDREELPR